MSADHQATYDDPRVVLVHNLPRQVNDVWLKTLFGSVGNVEAVELTFPNQMATGHAVVTFQTPEHAVASLDLDGFVALGSSLQVRLRADPNRRSLYKPPRPDNSLGVLFDRRASLPEGRLASAAVAAAADAGAARMLFNGPPKPVAPAAHKNLYVLNLPLDATTDQLAGLFGTYGRVVHCVILAMLDNQARRRGFIDMSSPDEAKSAIEGLNGYVWNGYPIEVSYAIVQRGNPFDETHGGKGIVKRNVPRNRYNTGPRRVPSDSSMTPAGPFPPNLSTLQPRHVSAPISATVPNSPSYPPESMMTPPQGPVTAIDPFTLLITGLAPSDCLDDEDFKAFLSPFGHVTNATLSKDEAGVSRGFGVVSFSTVLDAAAARAVLDGQLLNGRKISALPLYFTPSQLVRDAYVSSQVPSSPAPFLSSTMTDMFSSQAMAPQLSADGYFNHPLHYNPHLPPISRSVSLPRTTMHTSPLSTEATDALRGHIPPAARTPKPNNATSARSPNDSLGGDPKQHLQGLASGLPALLSVSPHSSASSSTASCRSPASQFSANESPESRRTSLSDDPVWAPSHGPGEDEGWSSAVVAVKGSPVKRLNGSSSPSCPSRGSTSDDGFRLNPPDLSALKV